MDRHGPTWTDMDRHGPTWTDMDRHGPTWTDMDRCRAIAAEPLLFLASAAVGCSGDGLCGGGWFYGALIPSAVWEAKGPAVGDAMDPEVQRDLVTESGVTLARVPCLGSQAERYRASTGR